MKWPLWCLIIGAGVSVYSNVSHRQERAEITFFNPKYIANPQAFTGRQKRGDPYKTNVTATIKEPWGNNVTTEIYYKSKGSPTPFTIQVRFCDIIKTKWMSDYLKMYSNIKLTCPLPVGTYSLINMEFPPKNFPLPIPNGDILVKLSNYITETKELFLQMKLTVHIA